MAEVAGMDEPRDMKGGHPWWLRLGGLPPGLDRRRQEALRTFDAQMLRRTRRVLAVYFGFAILSYLVLQIVFFARLWGWLIFVGLCVMLARSFFVNDRRLRRLVRDREDLAGPDWTQNQLT